MDTAQDRNRTLREITRRYYALWWMYSFAGGFLFGVYPLFLRSRGLDQFEINSVLAVYFFVTFLTDVPTGAFADALGRRRSFMLGSAMRVAAFVLYFFSHSYVLFLVAESIDGVGTTFCNGAIDAWGVDALDTAGFEGVKDRLFSRISQFSAVGFIAASLIGAYVADVNIAWPWLLGAAGYLVSLAVAAVLMRGENAARTPANLAAITREIGGRVGTGLRQGFSRRTVLLLSAAGAITVAAWAPYWMEWPLLFNDSYRVGIWIIGWIYGALTVARIIGAEVTARSKAGEPARASRLATLLFASAVLLGLAGVFGGRPNLALALLFLMNVCTGAMQPLVQSWFNELIAPEERATLLSFNSTFATFGGSLGLLFGGYVADAAGIPFQWQVAAVLSLLALPCYLALRPRAGTTRVAAPAK